MSYFLLWFKWFLILFIISMLWLVECEAYLKDDFKLATYLTGLLVFIVSFIMTLLEHILKQLKENKS